MRKNAAIRLGLLLALCIFLYAPVGHAQITSSISGTVTDSSGAPIPGVTISVESPSLVRGKVSVVTDATGHYIIPGLEAGTYTVRAEVKNFATEVRTEVGVPLNTEVRIDVSMKVAGGHEEVKVEGNEAPLIRTQDSDLTAAISNRTIDDIPLNGRQFLDLMSLAPASRHGLRRPTKGRTLQFSGSGPSPAHS